MSDERELTTIYNLHKRERRHEMKRRNNKQMKDWQPLPLSKKKKKVLLITEDISPWKMPCYWNSTNHAKIAMAPVI